MATQFGQIATSTATVVCSTLNTDPGDPGINRANISIYTPTGGAFASLTGVIESATGPDNNAQINWRQLVALNRQTGVQTSGTISPANSSTSSYSVDVGGDTQVRFRATGLASGTANVFISAYKDPQSPLNAASAASTLAGQTTITSNSANALAVGANGATNPVFNVNAATGSVATGVTVVGAAAGSGVEVQVITSGTNEALNVDAAAAAKIVLGGQAATAQGVQVGSATSAANTQLIVYTTNAAGLTVGRQGGTSPAFVVNSNAATCVTGVSVTAEASGSGVKLASTGGTGTETLYIDSQSTGGVTIASNSTGTVTVGANLTLTDAKNIVCGSSTGNEIGTATTQKIGFYGTAPITQPAANSDTTTGAAGSTTTCFLNTTWTGAGGTAAFTIGGVITKLKALGLLAP